MLSKPIVRCNGVKLAQAGTDPFSVFPLSTTLVFDVENIGDYAAVRWTLVRRPEGSTAALTSSTSNPTQIAGGESIPGDLWLRCVGTAANGEFKTTVAAVVMLTPNKKIRILDEKDVPNPRTRKALQATQIAADSVGGGSSTIIAPTADDLPNDAPAGSTAITLDTYDTWTRVTIGDESGWIPLTKTAYSVAQGFGLSSTLDNIFDGEARGGLYDLGAFIALGARRDIDLTITGKSVRFIALNAGSDAPGLVLYNSATGSTRLDGDISKAGYVVSWVQSALGPDEYGPPDPGHYELVPVPGADLSNYATKSYADDAAANAVASANGHADGAVSALASAVADTYATITSLSSLTFDASKITSGAFDPARIPDLDASKITTGTLAAARIPNLDASKITAGTLPVARGGTGVTASGGASHVLKGDGAGGWLSAQLAFSNLSGSATLAQLPTGTGVLKSAGAAPTYSTIVNADVAAGAAIDGSKIAPDFGAQTIATTGSIAAGSVGTGMSTLGDLRLGQATARTLVGLRNNGNSANIALLATDASNNVWIGSDSAGANLAPNVMYLASALGFAMRQSGSDVFRVSTSGLSSFVSRFSFVHNQTPLITQDTRVADAAANDITITSQAPFATATTNKNSGSLLLKTPAPVAGGAAGSIKLQPNGSTVLETADGKLAAFGATPVAKQTVTGSRGGNAALASLITALANLGLITDSTTA